MRGLYGYWLTQGEQVPARLILERGQEVIVEDGLGQRWNTTRDRFVEDATAEEYFPN